MGIQATVKWKGLTKLVKGIEDGKAKTKPSLSEFTRKLGKDVLDKYQENLSGAVPSTAARPLPVGVVTGELLAGARVKQVNQYRTDVYNDAGHSGWIEDGTSKMAPRRPLKNALDQIEETVPGRMGEVTRKITSS